MEIHVVSLKKAVDRRKSIEGQLQKLNLSYTIFDAVLGSALNQDELDELVDMEEVKKYPKWLTPNALGCSLSHMGVYKRMTDIMKICKRFFQSQNILPLDKHPGF